MADYDLIGEMLRLSALIDKGVAALHTAAIGEADAEQTYREARAQAWLTAEGKTAKEREDEVNAVTSPQRHARDVAAGSRQAALEALRSRRQQLSALQTIANGERAEAEFARTAPREVAS